MNMIVGEEPPEPYAEPRGICPECGSHRVTHHVLGGPDPRTEGSDPPWLQWQGCLPAFKDRSCGACDAIWHVESEEPLPPMRLIAGAGAAFALLPVPQIVPGSVQLEVDVELLTPDRLVRYLRRPADLASLAELAEQWLHIAEAEHPDLAVPTVRDVEMGLAVTVLGADTFTVTLEILVASDLSGEDPDDDGIAVDVLRADLVDAAHTLQEWLDSEGWEG